MSFKGYHHIINGKAEIIKIKKWNSTAKAFRSSMFRWISGVWPLLATTTKCQKINDEP